MERCTKMDQTYHRGTKDGGIKHHASLALFDYWSRQHRAGQAPTRNDIRPDDVRSLLPGIFILEGREPATLAFRLAGTGICSLFGRELRGATLDSLWLEKHSGQAREMTGTLLSKRAPRLVELLAESRAGRSLPLEMVILPFGDDKLWLGSINPLERPYWMNSDPLVGCLTVFSRRLDPAVLADRRRAEIASPPMAAYRSNALGAFKRVPHLVVIEGGRK